MPVTAAGLAGWVETSSRSYHAAGIRAGTLADLGSYIHRVAIANNRLCGHSPAGANSK